MRAQMGIDAPNFGPLTDAMLPNPPALSVKSGVCVTVSAAMLAPSCGRPPVRRQRRRERCGACGYRRRHLRPVRDRYQLPSHGIMAFARPLPPGTAR